MSETPPAEADLDALAASLHADSSDATVFFRVLCDKLLDALPQSTEVERDHSVFKSKRLARRVTVHIGDDTFEAELAQGEVSCHQAHAVHGVGGGMPWSKQLALDEWLHALVAAVAGEAHTSASAAAALRTLVT